MVWYAWDAYSLVVVITCSDYMSCVPRNKIFLHTSCVWWDVPSRDQWKGYVPTYVSHFMCDGMCPLGTSGRGMFPPTCLASWTAGSRHRLGSTTVATPTRLTAQTQMRRLPCRGRQCMAGAQWQPQPATPTG